MRLPVFIAVLLAIFAGFSSISAAQSTDEQTVEDRRSRLEQIAGSLNGSDVNLIDLREEIRTLRRAAEAAQVPIETEIAQINSDLNRLGPRPEEGETEAPAIAEERSRLTTELTSAEAVKAQIALNIAEAQRLAIEIANLRRSQFFEDLSARGPSPLQPALLGEAAETSALGFRRYAAALASYWEQKKAENATTGLFLSLALAVALAVALWIPVRGWLANFLAHRLEPYEPLPSRKVLVAAARTVVRLLPGLLGGVILLETLRANGAVSTQSYPLAQAIWFTFLGVLFVEGAAVGVFAPLAPKWRIVPLATSQARAVRLLLILAVLFLGLDQVVLRGADLFATSSALIIQIKALTTLLLALVLAGLSFKSLWTTKGEAAAEGVPVPTDPTQDSNRFPWGRIRFSGRVLACIAVLAALVGNVSLGHYLMTRLFYLLGLGSIIWFLRALFREGVRLVDANFRSQQAEELREKDGETASSPLTTYWIGVAIDVLCLLIFIPPALLILGAAWSDVRGGVTDAFLGFQVGPIRISFAKILLAITLTAFVMIVTRTAQRVVDRQIFPKAGIDPGVQNSLKTLIGYVGLLIAVMVGVGTLGFNLSSLAIIAGALSVGIGFGLQSIVNNFVSGLILLFERPIKVGDWIVTSSGEGIVQRISVRSTIIETFDKSSVIVPNAELISSAVTNWTHKNKLGRIVLPVGISYDLDPQVAIDVLMKVAKDDPDVLSYPPYYVYFDDFGDNSQNLQLRAYVRDIGLSLGIRTRLRVSIWRAFKEAGIEIPFPQRDLHIRSGLAGSSSTASSATVEEAGLPRRSPLAQPQSAADPSGAPDADPDGLGDAPR
ncbi:mechanosensitive ion channel family protein [Parvularcula bermudensis HTCC2503]|uniref:Mechanosensitive ion channel family protein n=1 Tax=Parvularcula bermudensis (strain ATCC BAA-594 / HTCC2503 / KCTC 12087) TaxID=314260 RepID=E0TG36_PARBH|nr:DUF3772 domain-containing protein [Parvularcula bermudensis]ADM10607.1 mechanosensitive ion channel family protein [Parvularcula bermudensis HTCC2503]